MVTAIDRLVALAGDAVKLWESFLSCHGEPLKQLLAPLTPQPSALGLKVLDATYLFSTVQAYFEQGDQVHFGPVDNRTIAVIWKQDPLALTIQYVKILQRRPGSDDLCGPEHLDLEIFAEVQFEELQQRLAALGIDCGVQRNASHEWLSIRYEEFEFKLVKEPVWVVCVQEAQSIFSRDA